MEDWDFRSEGTVAAELRWQRTVNGEAAKIDAFTEQVLGLQEFKAFASEVVIWIMGYIHSCFTYFFVIHTYLNV